MDAIDCEKVVQFITKLQNDDGSFSGDQWGEIDTRFSMCAVACLALLVSLFFNQCFINVKFSYLFFRQGRLDAININSAVNFVISCMNFDGGFGCRPGSESHAG